VSSFASPATRGARNGKHRRVGDKPNYFRRHRVGRTGRERRAFLSKGRPVAIDGALEWARGESQDGRNVRQPISLPTRSSSWARVRRSGGGGFAGNGLPRAVTSRSNDRDFQPAPAAVGPATTTFRSEYSEVLCVSPSPCLKSRPQPRGSHADGQSTRSAASRSAARQKGGLGSGRRKPCQHCRDKVEQSTTRTCSLKKFIPEKGKIRSRRIHGLLPPPPSADCPRGERARELALLPYVNEAARRHPRRERGDRDRER